MYLVKKCKCFVTQSWTFNKLTIMSNKQYIPVCTISCFLRLLNIRLRKCDVRWTLIPLHLPVAVYIGSAHVSYFVNICCKQNFNHFQCPSTHMNVIKEIPKPLTSLQFFPSHE